MLLALLLFVECLGCAIVFVTISWLRYLSGMGGRETSVIARFVMPLLTAMVLVGIVYLVIDELRRGTFHPETSQRMLGLVLFLGVVLAGMVGWLVVEVRYYRARPRDANRVIRSRSRRW